jgi:NADH-quinone oxidoreductase subunit L
MDTHLPWFILLAPLVSAGADPSALSRSAESARRSPLPPLVLRSWQVSASGFRPVPTVQIEVPWLDFRPALYVPIGFTIDALSKVMLLVVTGWARWYIVYSLVYMEDDEGQAALLRLIYRSSCFDARHRAREQLRDDVHLLGTRRRQLRIC